MKGIYVEILIQKTFRGITKKCENKNLIYFFSLRSGLGREGLSNTKATFEAQFMIKLSKTKSKK